MSMAEDLVILGMIWTAEGKINLKHNKKNWRHTLGDNKITAVEIRCGKRVSWEQHVKSLTFESLRRERGQV